MSVPIQVDLNNKINPVCIEQDWQIASKPECCKLATIMAVDIEDLPDLWLICGNNNESEVVRCLFQVFQKCEQGEINATCPCRNMKQKNSQEDVGVVMGCDMWNASVCQDPDSQKDEERE